MSETPPPPYGYGAYAPPAPLSPTDEKLWATLTHVGGIFFGFIPPLITYLVFKERGPFVRAHTATALNFQLTVLIAYVVIVPLSLITFGLGSFLILPVGIVVIVFSIIAAVASNNGQWYRYPASIAFVS